MADYTLKPITEMESIFHGAVRRAGAELGVESFGMQVFDLPGGFEGYPQHDHADDGMEEVYVLLRGAAEVEVDGETVTLDDNSMLRVGAGATRKLHPGPDGARVLALGAVPGKPYERPSSFQLGAPDPTAA